MLENELMWLLVELVMDGDGIDDDVVVVDLDYYWVLQRSTLFRRHHAESFRIVSLEPPIAFRMIDPLVQVSSLLVLCLLVMTWMKMMTSSSSLTSMGRDFDSDGIVGEDSAQ